MSLAGDDDDSDYGNPSPPLIDFEDATNAVDDPNYDPFPAFVEREQSDLYIPDDGDEFGRDVSDANSDVLSGLGDDSSSIKSSGRHSRTSSRNTGRNQSSSQRSSVGGSSGAAPRASSSSPNLLSNVVDNITGGRSMDLPSVGRPSSQGRRPNKRNGSSRNELSSAPNPQRPYSRQSGTYRSDSERTAAEVAERTRNPDLVRVSAQEGERLVAKFRKMYDEWFSSIFIDTNKKDRRENTFADPKIHKQNQQPGDNDGSTLRRRDDHAVRNINAPANQEIKLSGAMAIGALKFLSKLTKQVNYTSLAQAGVVRDSFAPQQHNGSASVDFDAVNDDNRMLSIAAFQDAVKSMRSSLSQDFETICDKVALSDETKQELNEKYNTMRNILESSLNVVVAATSLAISDSLPSVSYLNDTSPYTGNERGDNDTFSWLSSICSLLRRANLRRGANSDRLYAQTMLNFAAETRVWSAVISIRKAVEAVLSGFPQDDPMVKKWNSNKSFCTSKIQEADERFLESVSPNRSLFAFDNGWLDFENNLFIKRGSVASKTIGSKIIYRYAVNYFAGNFPDDGYDDDTGAFNFDGRLPPINPSTGLAEWDYEKMPEKHWSREPDIPILSDAIKTQQYDLHTTQNMYFGFARCARRADDELQVHTFLAGIPGSGKSTLGKFASFVFPPEFVAVFASNVESTFGFQDLIHPTDGYFVKFLGLVLDLAGGKFNIPTSVINSIISQELVNFAVKNGHSRSAKCDMQMLWIGNHFFQVSREEAPALARRFWIFPMNRIPRNHSNQVISDATVRAAMPAYMRRICIVWHEHNALKSMSPLGTIRSSTQVWDFASPTLWKIRSEYARKVSFAAKFVGDTEWIEKDENSIMSLESLRHLTRWYCKSTSLENRLVRAPSIDNVKDALTMLYPRASIEDWGSKLSRELHPDLYAQHPEGFTTLQMKDEIKNGTLYVKGVRIAESKLANCLLFWNDLKDRVGPETNDTAVANAVSNFAKGGSFAPRSTMPLSGGGRENGFKTPRNPISKSSRTPSSVAKRTSSSTNANSRNQMHAEMDDIMADAEIMFSDNTGFDVESQNSQSANGVAMDFSPDDDGDFMSFDGMV